jgi:hypothetical protein
MTYTESHPAPRKRVRLRSPREFIDHLRIEQPNATADELIRRYMTQVREHSIFDDAAWEILVLDPLEEWLRANVTGAPAVAIAARKAANGARERTPAERERRAALTKSIVEKIAKEDQQRIEMVVTVRLLEYQTTYGKPLGDCTGSECARLSRRYGAFFAEVAKRLLPAERVRGHLSELELQSIARSYRLIGPGAGER